MKIIIAGAGEVGFHLAKLLSYESQEITLIDTQRDSETKTQRIALNSNLQNWSTDKVDQIKSF